jgi:hypothetical protein
MTMFPYLIGASAGLGLASVATWFTFVVLRDEEGEVLPVVLFALALVTLGVAGWWR